MNHFLIITNVLKDENLEVTNKIIAYIQSKGGTAQSFCLQETRDWSSLNKEQINTNIECILVLGGDGTLIRTATHLEYLHIPLVGINLGTLGYLCELEEDNMFSGIDKLMDNQFILENRMMIEGGQMDSDSRKIALNDIVIHRIGDLSMIPLKVYVNNELLATYSADGIIIATPTGSTAYNMSAGGPIVDPKSNMLLLTPINEHKLNSRSLVLEASDVIEIEVGQRRAQKDEMAGVSFDGDSLIKLKVGERIIIHKASTDTKICRINKMSFLETLRRKMTVN